MTKILTFYGCSNTAGSELADHIVLGITFAECNKIKKDVTNFQIFYNKDNFKTSVSNLGKTMAYGATTSSMLNLQYKNFAFGGESLEASLLKILYHHNAKIITPVSNIIVLGITTQFRSLLFDTSRLSEFQADSIVLNANHVGEASKEISKHFLLANNQLNIDWFFLRNLLFLKSWSLEHGYTIFLQPTFKGNLLQSTFNGLEYSNFSYLPLFKSIIDEIQHLVPTHETLMGVMGWPPAEGRMCGYGHPSKIVHDEYAVILADALRKKGL